jgi:pyruvate/2-oxoglutarate dehydrogenase complex dihydrolipoamide acyltransferase (E2) component
MKEFITREFPKSRLATFDVYAAGKQKHHIAALLECDVTGSRLKLKALKAKGNRVSFTGWLIKEISKTLKEHKEAAAFLSGRRKIIIFNDIKISILVEKKINGMKVPMPLVIERSSDKSIEEITREITEGQTEELSEGTVVLNRKPAAMESFYYYMPGFMRRLVWKIMLKYPRFIYRKMGNAAVTSVGMAGQIRGWFIHASIHPVSFGIGSVIKKPLVIDDEIKVREVLNMTVLIDHDVIDGAPMARFVNALVKNIESGSCL